jgi:hypothetical protein
MKPFTFFMYNMFTASKHIYEKLIPLYDEILYAECQISEESTPGDFEEIAFLNELFETHMNRTEFLFAIKYKESIIKENDREIT